MFLLYVPARDDTSSEVSAYLKYTLLDTAVCLCVFVL